MVHRQTNNLVCHPISIRQILLRSTLQSAIDAERTNQRIEVSSPQHAVFLHLEVKLITSHTILFGIHEDGEIGIVMLYPRHVVEERDARNIAKSFAVFYSYLMAILNGFVHLTKIQQTVSGTHLVHLAVDTRSNHLCFACKTEILQVVDTLLRLFVVHHQSTAFDGIIHFRSMEAQSGHITSRQDAFTVHLHTESMGCIVNHFQSVFIGNPLNTFHVTGLSIYMNGHDCRCFRSNGSFYFIRINVAGCRVNVHKHRLDAIPPNRMGSGNKTVRSGNDLARNAERLQGGYQRQCPIGKQADIRHFQVLTKCLFQLLMIMTVVSNPLAVPNILQEFIEFVQIGQ